MRWFWIDRFVEFESGRRAVTIKNVSLAEDQIDRYQPGLPVMPCSLIIEGLAQTGGLLIGEHNQFRERVVLAKVTRAEFFFPVRPGDTLIYTAVTDDIRPTGAICQGTSHCDGRLQADIELVFAHLDERFRGIDQFEPADFLRMLRLWRLYDVARTAAGEPLPVPAHLLQAEADEDAAGGPPAAR
jgi:3-hydroxyacyl-[acyl-carrier-protein] dehydratase